MNYIIDQINEQAHNAGPKAREDINVILAEHGYTQRKLSCSYSSSPLSIVRDMHLMDYQLKQSVAQLQKGDAFILQYPYRCASARTGKSLARIAHSKGIIAVALIHNLLNLRGNTSGLLGALTGRIRDDISFLREFDFIIAHNERMKELLVVSGIEERKVIPLQLFDYLVRSREHHTVDHRNENWRKLIIAGNLSPEKASYLNCLKRLDISAHKGFRVELYGSGYTGDSNDFVSYMGTFLADSPQSAIKSGFGLVWDGDSIDTCAGPYGEYLRINNPHKLSLYIACGIPVFAWEDSAVSSFIKEYNLGFTVSSLLEIPSIIDSLSNQDYQKLTTSVSAIQKRVLNGYYTLEACKQVLR